MSNVSKSMTTKSEQDEEMRESERLFKQLRTDINILEKKDFAVLKGELERIVGEVERLKGTLREEVGRVHGGVRLDINLEKARIQDEAASLRDMVTKAEERIDKEIEALTNRMIQIRDGTRSSLQRGCLALGFNEGYALQWIFTKTFSLLTEFIGLTFVAFCAYKLINYNTNS
ncbi:hypothetical protein HDV00_001682 [Rhizophlyctis rosea]|nr:hypothetical protein HDV00_001682 [Rhizophlyctis rosea]